MAEVTNEPIFEVLKNIRRRVWSKACATFAFLALLTSGALACDTRPVANGAAEFNSCETPWAWSSGDGSEDLYLCAADICPQTTVLRISLRDIAEPDLGKDHDRLMQEWTETTLPKESGGYRIEMIEKISIVEMGGKTGVLIPTRLTADDGTAMTSFAFRVPLDKHYVVANATGEAEPDVIRDALVKAVENLAIPERSVP